MDSNLWFHFEDVKFRLEQRKALRSWILESSSQEGKAVSDLNYIFCSDQHLHSINVEYLDHDTFTDIITFDYSEAQVIAGDIFISWDRVKANAKKFKVKTRDELHRVIIHGTLHLLGYGDKTEAEKRTMTAKEDYYLSLRTF